MARGAGAGLMLTAMLLLLALGMAVGSLPLLGVDVAGFDNLADAWFAMLRATLGAVRLIFLRPVELSLLSYSFCRRFLGPSDPRIL